MALGGGTVGFPADTYLCHSIRLTSFVALYLERGATIRAAPAGGSSSRLSRHTHWYGGERGEETQLFPMPGLILGRLPLYGRLNFVIGAGHQFAVTPKVTEVPVLTPIYNHAWLISARTPF